MFFNFLNLHKHSMYRVVTGEGGETQGRKVAVGGEGEAEEVHADLLLGEVHREGRPQTLQRRVQLLLLGQGRDERWGFRDLLTTPGMLEEL